MRPSFLNEAVRKISTDKFDQHSKSNELLKALRYLIQVNKKMQCYAKPDNFSFTWGQLDPSAVAKHLCGVCSELKEVMMKEPRMLDIASPVYIMGTYTICVLLLLLQSLFQETSTATSPTCCTSRRSCGTWGPPCALATFSSSETTSIGACSASRSSVISSPTNSRAPEKCLC